MKKIYAPAYKHDPIMPLLDNVYWVHGSVRMAPSMYMNRNMVIIKEGNALFLINPVRLNEHEEIKLKVLGEIKAVIRLGDFHGLDDQYYIDTFECEFWCQPKQSTYPLPKPDHLINEESVSPIKNSEFFIFSKALFPESALYLKDTKLLITTDSIQYWTDWQYMSVTGKLLLWTMGFRTELFIGKPWLKRVTPNQGSLKNDFESLLTLNFEHLIGAHGKPLMNCAHGKVKDLIKMAFD